MEEELQWKKQNSLKEKIVVEIHINKSPTMKEIWWEGKIVYEGKDHPFWVIEPTDCEYEIELRWWFKEPPIIRKMSNKIVENFKKIHNYDGNKK